MPNNVAEENIKHRIYIYIYILIWGFAKTCFARTRWLKSLCAVLVRTPRPSLCAPCAHGTFQCLIRNAQKRLLCGILVRDPCALILVCTCARQTAHNSRYLKSRKNTPLCTRTVHKEPLLANSHIYIYIYLICIEKYIVVWAALRRLRKKRSLVNTGEGALSISAHPA